MPDSLPPGHRIDVCWGRLSPGQVEQVAAFLNADALKDPAAALQRAGMTAALAYDENDNIIGHMSAEPRYISQLLNRFWVIAVYAAREHRRQAIPRLLSLQVRDFFEQRFLAGQDTDIIGIFMAMQSPVYQKHKTRAVTEVSRYIFVGRNRAGHDMRVYYFKGARIDSSHLDVDQAE